MFTADQYELLDFGDGRKLERFGAKVLDRPSPAAEDASRTAPARWREAAARFERTSGERGEWQTPSPLAREGRGEGDAAVWTTQHDQLTFELRFTEFGHVGLFPEQADNWDWIARQVRAALQPPAPPGDSAASDSTPGQSPGLKVLNLFAYTGASTLVAAAAGASVTHVDAARSTVAWARQNAALSGLGEAPIRWIDEDARRFAARELKRGRRYDAVILDPPSYGHGSRGEAWKIDEHLPELLELCAALTSPRPAFMLLSSHSPGYAGEHLAELVARAWHVDHVQPTEMQLTTTDGRVLPSGTSARWGRGEN